MFRIVDLLKPDAGGNLCKTLEEAQWKIVSMIERHENNGRSFEKKDVEGRGLPSYKVIDLNDEVIHIYMITM